jgi:hypothetical protein|tara:strand:- start:622 stop:849 length:228 start_codon:yes stop_codon:yes gene_type:complete
MTSHKPVTSFKSNKLLLSSRFLQASRKFFLNTIAVSSTQSQAQAELQSQAQAEAEAQAQAASGQLTGSGLNSNNL